MEKILITGGNGLIGKSLTDVLISEGYEVVHLVRSLNADSPVKQIKWNPEKNELDESVFEGVDHVIHLAGSNIGEGRWTKKRRKEIRSSRIDSANLLFEKSKNSKLRSFISASGISIYGTLTSEKIFDEEDEVKNDFLAQVTVDWENAADQFSARGVRVVKIRTSVVLSKKGGAFQKMIRPVQMGIGSALGNGKQYFPWIHLEDICRIYLKTIQDDSMHGAHNAVAPDHCTNKELTKKIATILGKKIWLPPVPGFLLKLFFGEMANLILKGSRVSSDKIQKAGFEFKFSKLDDALQDCLT